MPNYQQPENNGYDVLHKFGCNNDADTGAAEDIWDTGGLYSFPAAAAEINLPGWIKIV